MLHPETGPNARVIASGQLTIPQMAIAGLGLTILSIVIIVTLLYCIIHPFFNITSSHPVWI
jgi:di/tricarboxylate transporter